MKVTTVGLDLAKNVFQVHGIDSTGGVIVRRSLRRRQMMPFFGKLKPCLIDIEACGTSHFWSRELRALGHEVKLTSPIYVKPYVKRGKTDAADAETICEAVTRPTMRFVAIESAEQIRELQARVAMTRGEIKAWFRGNDLAKRLATIPGIGYITASALAASVTDPRRFTSARQFTASLGLTPKADSSAGKDRPLAPRRSPRPCPVAIGYSGLLTVPARPQEGGDVLCPSQTHPEA